MLLRRLGLVDLPDWAAWVAREVSGERSDVVVEGMLDELVDAHMLEPRGSDAVGQARFRLHGLIADFAHERAEAEEPAQERAAAATRLSRAWRELAVAADEHLTRSAEWFEVERTNLVLTVLRACEAGDAESAGSLALPMAGFLTTRSHDDDADRVLSAATAAVRAAGPPQLLIPLLRALFVTRSQRYRIADLPSIAREELSTARAVADVHAEVLALGHCARAARKLGRFTEAAAWLEQAADLIRRRDVTQSKLMTSVLATLAGLYVDMGYAQRALPLCEQVLRLDEEQGADRSMGIHLLMQGIALTECDLVDRAESAFAEALRTAEALKDDRGRAFVELNHAELDLRVGRLADAERRITEALDVVHRVDDHEGIAEALRLLGDLAMARHEPATAAGFFEQSLALWEADGSQLECARTLAHLALADSRTTAHHDRSRRILDELGLDERCLRLAPFLTSPRQR